jgi:molybdopterin converting factor small subunit
MKLHVQYAAQLRAAVGRNEEEVELPDGSSLAELLVYLAANCGPGAEPHLLTDRRQVRPSLLLVLNDTAVPSSQAARTVLRTGDNVILLPPIAGG